MRTELLTLREVMTPWRHEALLDELLETITPSRPLPGVGRHEQDQQDVRDRLPHWRPRDGRCGQERQTAGHHPDIDLRWGRLRFGTTTRDAGNHVTDLDFVSAQRIDEIAARHGVTGV